jgi:class 3 adenylate cyclase
MTETRKLAAILVSDVVGYSRLTGADEDRILARLRTLRSDLIEPTIAVHHGRVVKRTGDGAIVEFRSVVDAVRCAIEMQHGMVERNAGLPPERRIEFRIGVHLGDVVEESDGDLMGEGVNIAARLQGVANPGAICLSEPTCDRHGRPPQGGGARGVKQSAPLGRWPPALGALRRVVRCGSRPLPHHVGEVAMVDTATNTSGCGSAT